MLLFFSAMSDQRSADFSRVTHSGVGKAGGSDLHLAHDLLPVNRSDPVIILSPRQPVCMPAHPFVIFTFSSQVWLEGLAALVSHLTV